MYYTSCMKNW